MKKKELMKRFAAFSIAAMVTASTVPTTAFAADIEFSDVAEDADVDLAEDNEGTDDVAAVADNNVDAAEAGDMFSDDDTAEAVGASTVKIIVMGDDGKVISNPTITLEKMNGDKIKVTADAAGNYNITPGEYFVTIVADGYESIEGSYAYISGNRTFTLKKTISKVDPEDQATVNALKEEFDNDTSVIYPGYDDTNIQTAVLAKIKNTDTTGVTVQVVSSTDPDFVDTDGTVKHIQWIWDDDHYKTSVVFKFEKKGAVSEATAAHTVRARWDKNKVNNGIRTEKESLERQGINGKESVVTAERIDLPFYKGESKMKSYGEITWESSNANILKVVQRGATIYGVPNVQNKDVRVTLTATIQASPVILSEVENASDFDNYTLTFDLVVEGNLSKKIKEAQAFVDSMTEGTEPDQYPEGTKAELQDAIDEAKKSTEAEEDKAAKALETLNTVETEAKGTLIPRTVNVTVRANESADVAGATRNLEVKSNAAAGYGYTKPEDVKNKVTLVDLLYTLHAAMYEDFASAPEKYLSIDENGNVSKIFGKDASATYSINNVYGKTSVNSTVLNGNEDIVVAPQSKKILYFDVDTKPSTVHTGKEFTVILKGSDDKEAAKVEAGCTVALKNSETGEIVEGTTDEEGKVTLKADVKAGKYLLTVTKAPYDSYVVPSDEIEVTAHEFDNGKVTKEATCKEAGVKTYTCKVCGATKTETIAKTTDHKYTWKTVSEATVFAPEKQQGTCSVCGTTVTKENGTKLTATIKLNATSIKLQKKQTTKKIKVAMANGDSVKSWKSSNKKIVTVNKNGVIKAGKKNGTAKITVTLASGKKATLKVKVQTPRVNTTKIRGLKSKVVVENGKKLVLKPVISPLTSQDKVTYTSSNKKVATVSKNGVITAKKKGIAKIKVKSGKKSYTVTVTVK